MPYDMRCVTCREPNCIHYGCKAGSVWTSKNVEQIKAEIMSNGPVAGGFMVYRDFLYYGGGVYYHKQGEQLGGHAIEVVGWGVEDGLNYWTCKNSWSAAWGVDGYFKIKMGDSDVDNNMIACEPRV